MVVSVTYPTPACARVEKTPNDRIMFCYLRFVRMELLHRRLPWIVNEIPWYYYNDKRLCIFGEIRKPYGTCSGQTSRTLFCRPFVKKKGIPIQNTIRWNNRGALFALVYELST